MYISGNLYDNLTCFCLRSVSYHKAFHVMNESLILGWTPSEISTNQDLLWKCLYNMVNVDSDDLLKKNALCMPWWAFLVAFYINMIRPHSVVTHCVGKLLRFAWVAIAQHVFQWPAMTWSCLPRMGSKELPRFRKTVMHLGNISATFPKWVARNVVECATTISPFPRYTREYTVFCNIKSNQNRLFQISSC